MRRVRVAFSRPSDSVSGAAGVSVRKAGGAVTVKLTSARWVTVRVQTSTWPTLTGEGAQASTTSGGGPWGGGASVTAALAGAAGKMGGGNPASAASNHSRGRKALTASTES